MYTPEERARLRAESLEWARNDGRISGAAVTGSAAAGREDGWSDIDLAFGVAEAGRLREVLEDWTRRMYERRGAADHTDIHAGPWVYRVFLLSNTLQVDLAFVRREDFRPLAPTFRLELGEAGEALAMPGPRAADLIAMGWLYAVHARSSIARGKFWQAEYMISGVRDHALALACLRHGLPAVHGKGMDDLPADVAASFEGALVGRLEAGALSSAFAVAVEGLLREARHADGEIAGRLEGVLRRLVDSVSASSRTSHS
jgi:hypothetical protein